MKKIFPASKTYVTDSKIKNAGRGVFAANDIRQGQIIEVCPIILVPEHDMSNLAESILVTYFFYFGKKNEYLAIVLGFGSIYNHSYEPNAKYKIKKSENTMTFTAIENIKKNKEITISYSPLENKAPLWFEVLE